MGLLYCQPGGTLIKSFSQLLLLSMDKKLVQGTYFKKCRDLWCPVHHIRFCPLPVDGGTAGLRNIALHRKLMMGKLQRTTPSIKSRVFARAPQIPSLSLYSGWPFHSCGLLSTVIRLKPPVRVFPERTHSVLTDESEFDFRQKQNMLSSPRL